MGLKKACEDDASLLLEDDTYLCIMALFSEANEDASWRSDLATRRQIEGAAFEMLGRLCSSSQLGRKTIARTEKCNDCATKALEVVSSFITTDETVNNTALPFRLRVVNNTAIYPTWHGLIC